MTPEQIKTVVMLWNFFKSIDLELNGDVWMEFVTSDKTNSNRINISRMAIAGQELGTIDYLYTVDVHGFGIWVNSLILGADTAIDTYSDRIEINGCDPSHSVCPCFQVDELKAITITCFSPESTVLFQNKTTF